MTPFPHIAQRLFNVPLAIHPRKAEIVIAAIADRLGVAHLVRIDGQEARHSPSLMGEGIEDEDDRAAGYDAVAGVAVIPVYGTLVQRTGALRPYSGMTGYDGIRVNLLAALVDPAIEAVVLDIDSPGGECAGLFDLVDTIAAAKETKPVWAILNESAYSAAYALACAATKVTIPRTGGAGSIGVIAMHVDLSRALSAEGITVTLVAHGDRKADFAETAPLSRDARALLQADVDALAALFNATVAANRGTSPARIDAMEAGLFRGAEAVRAGLVDAVMAPDEAFRALLASL